MKRNYTEVSEQRYRWVEGKPRAKLQRQATCISLMKHDTSILQCIPPGFCNTSAKVSGLHKQSNVLWPGLGGVGSRCLTCVASLQVLGIATRERESSEPCEAQINHIAWGPRRLSRKSACACRLSKEGKVRTVKLKQIFAIQSDYAVGKAVDDAEAKVSEAEDGRAFAKVCKSRPISKEHRRI